MSYSLMCSFCTLRLCYTMLLPSPRERDEVFPSELCRISSDQGHGLTRNPLFGAMNDAERASAKPSTDNEVA
ncbi:hypothetical protein M405DRAFT_805066 [Rhizopogon salebrosus TDB-379]|nr:hypothetical protein M405DRAFT_805066 [Rhizopogon salebrosus TDB-379]